MIMPDGTDNGHTPELPPVARAVILEWLQHHLKVWSGQEIAAEHLLKLLISDVRYLPSTADA